jgi:hypothetical protein
MKHVEQKDYVGEQKYIDKKKYVEQQKYVGQQKYVEQQWYVGINSRKNDRSIYVEQNIIFENQVIQRMAYFEDPRGAVF